MRQTTDAISIAFHAFIDSMNEWLHHTNSEPGQQAPYLNEDGEEEYELEPSEEDFAYYDRQWLEKALAIAVRITDLDIVGIENTSHKYIFQSLKTEFLCMMRSWMLKRCDCRELAERAVTAANKTPCRPGLSAPREYDDELLQTKLTDLFEEVKKFDEETSHYQDPLI